jgi:hypothetical protein
MKTAARDGVSRKCNNYDKNSNVLAGFIDFRAYKAAGSFDQFIAQCPFKLNKDLSAAR